MNNEWKNFLQRIRDNESLENDRNFIDKVNKFLGDNEFSIKSVQFMKTNSFNKDFVEKLSDHRACIWSRRESRTPVRVFLFLFILSILLHIMLYMLTLKTMPI